MIGRRTPHKHDIIGILRNLRQERLFTVQPDLEDGAVMVLMVVTGLENS